MRSVVLYGRAGCCLCEEAREVLLRVRERHPFTLEERDIEQDERLLKRYLERIPVVTIDGRETFAMFVDEELLARALIDGRAEKDPRAGKERQGRVQPG